MTSNFRYKRTRYRVLAGSAAIHIVNQRNASGQGIARCGHVGRQSDANHSCVTCGPCQDAKN